MSFSIIEALMTPKDLLCQEEFPLAQTILPTYFANFNSLLAEKQSISQLKTLPIKSLDVRTKYREMRDYLLPDILQLLSDKPAAYSVNAFPYFLPPDVEQGIIWVAEHAAEAVVVQFIVDRLALLKISPHEVILFERPKATKTLMVKGTFPQVRHIHMWTKKGIL